MLYLREYTIFNPKIQHFTLIFLFTFNNSSDLSLAVTTKSRKTSANANYFGPFMIKLESMCNKTEL